MRAYFIGSVNLDSAEDVLTTIAERAGEVTPSIPDGETGDRAGWMHWQLGPLNSQPQLVGVGDVDVSDGYDTFSRFRLADGVKGDDFGLGPIGYAREAIRSYAEFARLKEGGRIPRATRFLVSVPTPVAITFGFMQDDQLIFEQGCERSLLSEIATMLDEIPEDELAIQWDVAVEMGMLEGVFDTWLDGDLLPQFVERLGRLGDAISPQVSLGYHLCYGNRNNAHWKEPADAGLLVQMANGIVRSCHRLVDWIHMPVPIERDDEDYFEPLRNLLLPADTELVLGLLHKEDGLEGARRRIATARRFADAFAIAAECGMGREPRESIGGLVDLHAQACQELDPS